MKKLIIILVAVHFLIFSGWFLFLGHKKSSKKIINSNLLLDQIKDDKISTTGIPIKNEKGFSLEIANDKNGSNEFSKSLLTPEVEAILQLPESVILFSLEPKYQEELKDGEEHFNHFKVLGQVDLTIDQMAIAIDQVETMVYDSHQIDKDFCFNPRHGLRIKSEYKTVDFLISFECSKMQIITKTITKFKELPISGNAEELNKILQEHQIKLQLEPPSNK